jgi:hypothetical protein
MGKTGGADQFANLAVITVTETAANTLTFKKLETGISLFEKVAWIVHRIEYNVQVLATVFDGTGDRLIIGLTATDQLTAISEANNAVLDYISIQRSDWGTAATSIIQFRPYLKDLSTLPGGGLIIPPNPVYLGAVGTGLASATTTVARLFYTTKTLSPDEYWELVEARRIISS